MGNKILVADDSKLVISLVKNIFENENKNFTVICANDGKEAIEKAINEMPDIILMDWQMPEMSGLEALKELRSNEKTKQMPIIMLTASETIGEAFKLGANDFVPKPFNKDELIARVHTLLELVNIRNELKQKNIDHEIQNNKLKLQKEILVKQKKELSEAREIANKVNKIILPSNDMLKELIPEHFILSMPVNEIPSNFYWLAKKEKYIFLCLGFLPNSNISSAIFTSCAVNVFHELLMVNFDLKEIKPIQALEKLREKFSDNPTTDLSLKRSADIVFCIIDLDKKILQYSGVNVPVFVIKNDKLVELKTDNSETGIIDKSLKLTNHKVQLANNDLLYILNDGFNDNSDVIVESGYISKEISEILKKIHQKEMNKQKELLERTFKNWRKDLKQINDILALSIKF